ncbi:glycosyltransferase [Kineococcus indalonis]|uniref:glycosyltransferase n=1 Tax=Kineococcus indalonis TaxID=2696566 RepID=UPI0014125B7F|nr:glycosyltransferase [Kineococcus indalonis]NAZ85187.1 glycosyltransferase [Kineococcus indalonis]
MDLAAGASVSVVIPAHDEARTLRRTLEALRAAAVHEVPEVVVVANGCTDGTADVARAAGATVVELGAASKAAALRAGDEVATAFPRVYLDADIVLTPGTLDSLAARLRAGDLLAASPRVEFDTSASSWPVRAFYRAYRELPYVREGLVGLGVYGLSARGRSRFGQFPDVTSDDLFVQRLFGEDERGSSGGTFVVAAPRDLRNLVKVRTRTAAGNAELSRSAGDAPPAAAVEDRFGRSTSRTSTALLRTVGRRPALVPSFAVYTAVTVASRVLARRQGTAWQRDSSTR